MRTFLSRNAEFPSFGINVSTCLLPSQTIFQNRGGHLQKCAFISLKENYPPYDLHEGKFFFPTKGLAYSYEVRKVAWIIPSCGSPLIWGPAVMHRQLCSLSQDTGQPQPEMLFPVYCVCNFRIKKHHGLPISLFRYSQLLHPIISFHKEYSLDCSEIFPYSTSYLNRK